MEFSLLRVLDLPEAEARKVIYDIADLLDPIGAGKITNWGRAPDIAILNDEGVPVMP